MAVWNKAFCVVNQLITQFIKYAKFIYLEAWRKKKQPFLYAWIFSGGPQDFDWSAEIHCCFQLHFYMHVQIHSQNYTSHYKISHFYSRCLFYLNTEVFHEIS